MQRKIRTPFRIDIKIKRYKNKYFTKEDTIFLKRLSQLCGELWFHDKKKHNYF